jgi:hypothetical protein
MASMQKIMMQRGGGLRCAVWAVGLAMVAALASAQAPPPGGPAPAAGARGGGARGGGSRPLPANAPAPSPDPRNFDGTWTHGSRMVSLITTDMFGNATPLNELGRKVVNRRVQSLKDGTPFINASARCIPMGQPVQMDLSMPFQVLQSKDRLEFMFEEFHGLITVQLDPAKALRPGYMGSSVGRWDGDTLVVETSGFKDDFWLDVNGTPASKNAKLTQRIRKVKTDHWYLEVIFTLEDPTFYTRPWSWARDYEWRPDMRLFREYNCEVQTGAEGGVDPSLVPEPKDD